MDNSNLTKFNLYNLRYLNELKIQYTENFGTDRGDRVFQTIQAFGTKGTIHKVIFKDKSTGLEFYLLLVNTTREAILESYKNNWRGFQDRFYSPEIIEMETGKLFMDK